MAQLEDIRPFGCIFQDRGMRFHQFGIADSVYRLTTDDFELIKQPMPSNRRHEGCPPIQVKTRSVANHKADWARGFQDWLMKQLEEFQRHEVPRSSSVHQ